MEIVEQHDRIMASEFAEAIALQGLVKVQGGARRPKERAQQIKHKHQTKQKLTEPTYTNTAKLPKDPHTCPLNANGPGLSKANMTSKSLARRSRQKTFKAALLPVCCMRLSNDITQPAHRVAGEPGLRFVLPEAATRAASLGHVLAMSVKRRLVTVNFLRLSMSLANNVCKAANNMCNNVA